MLMEDESNAPKMILISYIICKDRILMTLLPYTEIFGKKKGGGYRLRPYTKVSDNK